MPLTETFILKQMMVIYTHLKINYWIKLNKDYGRWTQFPTVALYMMTAECDWVKLVAELKPF